MPDDACQSMLYTGSSMNPTLKTLDILQVLPYPGKKIQPGDVIVFFNPEGKGTIAHRVVRVDAQGIRTRGDNSSYPDSWVLSPDNIVGRVVWAQRGSTRRSIYAGLKGRLCSLGIKAMLKIDAGVSFLLRPIYHRLVQTGVLRRWLAKWIETRILSLDRPAGRELQLLIGRRTIGRLMPGKSQWVIRRPFRLFVDETSLPRAPFK